MSTRIEKDSLGDVEVPSDALYGAQTQRAINNFQFGHYPLSPAFYQCLGKVKIAAAFANQTLGKLSADKAALIQETVNSFELDDFARLFPIGVYQTGSGTSSNMNMNEVIAHKAKQLNASINLHPNDDINMSQSSNDVIPTTLRVAAVCLAHQQLLPQLKATIASLLNRANGLKESYKTGRTHLMDAVPISFEDTLNGFAAQLQHALAALETSLLEMQRLPQGGTAVGIGTNAPKAFDNQFCDHLSNLMNIKFQSVANHVEAQSTLDTPAQFSYQLKRLAQALIKIANDIRWMNSGPINGLSEITLEALQPGSSIMPGKVNPVIEEAVLMACAKVIGLDATISTANLQSQFELNVMQPLVAQSLLEMIELTAQSLKHLTDFSIDTFKVNEKSNHDKIGLNPILVTSLNSLIGYDKAAAIAKKSYQTGRALIDIALEETDLDRHELEKLLHPRQFKSE